MGQLSFKTGLRRRKGIGVALKVSDELVFKAFAVNAIDSTGAVAEESMELFVGWMKLVTS